MLSLCTSWGTAGRRLALSALSEAARRVAQPGLSVVHKVMLHPACQVDLMRTYSKVL